jgi:hypothetical protein
VWPDITSFQSTEQLADLIVEKLNDSAPSSAKSLTAAAASGPVDAQRQVEDLQRTIQRLEERDAPRQLTFDQGEKLYAHLTNLEPQPIAIVSFGNDSEADRYRDQLGEVFRRAGWAVAVRTAIAAIDVEGVSLDYFAGHLRSSPPGADTIHLQAALERAGIPVRPRSMPEDEGEWHWMLTSGRKPRN